MLGPLCGQPDTKIKDILLKSTTKTIRKMLSQELDILQKHLQIDQPIFTSYRTRAMNFCASLGFLCIRDTGCRENKITTQDSNGHCHRQPNKKVVPWGTIT